MAAKKKTEEQASVYINREILDMLRGPKRKTGKNTSEFVLAIVAKAIGLAVAIWGAYKGNDTLVGIGGSIAGLSAGAYGISRGLAKRTEENPQPAKPWGPSPAEDF